LIEGGGGIYVCSRDFCSCPAGSFGKKCSHKEAIRNMPVKLSDAIKSIKHLPSSIRQLNKELGGFLYNDDEIVCIYGKPNVGKSLFAFQEACYIASLGNNVLYIDTEGGFKAMALKWHKVFKKRFGKLEGEIYLEVKKTMRTLHDYLGFRTDVVYKVSGRKADEKQTKLVEQKKTKRKKKKKTEKGKMEFKILETYPEAEIDRVVDKYDIDFIILDSVTSPIRLAISDEQQNNPAKATAMGLIYGKLLELMELKGVAVLTTNHASWNPADPYQTLANMRGGVVAHHYSKRWFYMDRRQKKGVENYRKLWMVRVEDMPEFGKVFPLKIDDDGFHYADDISLEDLLTESERRNLGL